MQICTIKPLYYETRDVSATWAPIVLKKPCQIIESQGINVCYNKIFKTL